MSDEPEPHDGLAGTPEAERERLAGNLVGTGLRHAAVARTFAASTLGGGGWEELTPHDAIATFRRKIGEVNGGDITPALSLLMAQAIALDAVFTDMMIRAASNVGKYPEAVERYMRLGLKAQANSRTTLEALAKIARGGEQVVRHVHVDNRGGQAVIAETVQTGGANALSTDQPHAVPEIMLRGEDALGCDLPEPGDEERSLPDARWNVTGSSQGQPQRLETRRAIGRS